MHSSHAHLRSRRSAVPTRAASCQATRASATAPGHIRVCSRAITAAMGRRPSPGT
ncbi:hypothetical protein [Nonomuraea aridisoli]|uniref:hypothetical protein n=1 Tax=Nonomuraea aridisoli TaxID=2070368 RepID=UPI0015E8A68E|nr:hypothetical protein [Nonomuraea aridisoli]